MLDNLTRWQKFNIFFAVSFIIVSISFLVFYKTSITGYVHSIYVLDNLEIVVLKDQVYEIISDESLDLKSVFISGKIAGQGKVDIFIENENKRYLLYSNSRKDEGLSSITGLFVKDSEDPGLMIKPVDDDFLPEFEEKEEKDTYSEELKSFLSLLESEMEDKKSYVADFIKKSENMEFSNECVETCMLFDFNSNKYNIVFDIGHGTSLLITEIIYSVEK